MIRNSEFVLPNGVDEECKSLVIKLNELKGIETTSCCCGHFKNPYMVFFDCNDFIALGRLYRCVNKNYSDGKWRIECCCSDGMPTHGFMLRSHEIFKNQDEMMDSVNRLIENIDFWQKSIYDEYFNQSFEEYYKQINGA